MTEWYVYFHNGTREAGYLTREDAMKGALESLKRPDLRGVDCVKSSDGQVIGLNEILRFNGEQC